MANHLIHETSPYLQQHANNPVDWHAWNPEALRLAREQDKPILLSIGYSACHWCHVMAHESFEDTEVAAIMNAHFINIKVDREERPDLDQIYQTAHAMLTQRSGGWPLTMFLSPDGTPFFGGTYFPKRNSHNLPAFPDVLKRVAEVYTENRAELAAQGKQLIAALAERQPPADTSVTTLHNAPLALAAEQLAANFDRAEGGFGDAPKFPHPTELDFLLRRSHADKDEHARHIVLHTLRQMAHGGIYDQLGGGFCRYSVDEYWNIPHFEKMLYDNGLLLALYSEAWQSSGDPLFAQVVEQTANWVMREMQAPSEHGKDVASEDEFRHARFPLPNPLPLYPLSNFPPQAGERANETGNFQSTGEGANESLREINVNRGYYSSLDADSEHEEGKYYVWQRDEVRSLLSAEEYAVLAPHYGLERASNFEQLAWHLHVSTPLSAVAASLQLGEQQAAELLSRAQAKLFAARGKRIRPGRDEKILGSWNGLMITGMARAAQTFRRPDWLHSAQRAMDFVRNTLWRDGKLLATCKDGKAHLNAYLDDHAFLLQAALELLQAEFRRDDLVFATQLADALLVRFEDRQHGGFFFTSHDHEALIQRSKIGQDNATPAGNGIAAQALQRLSIITGKPEYAAAAERCLKLFFPLLRQATSYHTGLCTALAENLQPTALLVLRGEPREVAAWRNELRQNYFPGVLTIAPDGNAGDLPGPLNQPDSAQTTAWLCAGTRCLPPLTRIEDLLSALRSS